MDVMSWLSTMSHSIEVIDFVDAAVVYVVGTTVVAKSHLVGVIMNLDSGACDPDCACLASEVTV